MGLILKESSNRNFAVKNTPSLYSKTKKKLLMFNLFSDGDGMAESVTRQCLMRTVTGDSVLLNERDQLSQ